MSLLARVALLTGIWLLAWGSARPETVVAGVASSIVLLVAFPPARGAAPLRRGVRPFAVARLLAYLAWQLVTSNVVVARTILSRRARVRTGVVVHELATASPWVMTVVANTIALTPGTMTVDTTRFPPTIEVHFLLLDDPDAARRGLARLERLVTAAVGGTVSRGDA